MNTTFKIIIVALLIGANLYAKNHGEQTAVIVCFDIAGLNNANSSNELFQQNMQHYNKLISKQSLRRIEASSIAYYTVEETVRFIGRVESKKAGRLYRESKKIMKTVAYELQQDQSSKGKDIIGLFYFLNQLIEQEYTGFNQVEVHIYSNLRDSISSKEARKNMGTIKVDDKVSLYLYAASGLNAIDGGITIQQKMNAEASVIKYYKNLLLTPKLIMKTMY